MKVEVIIDTIEADGFEMDYCSFGQGNRAMVIIPGLSLTPVTPNARAVARQYKSFADDYCVYLFDRKRNAEMGYTIEQMAADTAKAMKELGIKDACVMGCSQGGMIAQVIAATEPGLVGRLALCSTTACVVEYSKGVFSRWEKLAREGEPVPFNHDVFTHVYSKKYYEQRARAFAMAERVASEKDLNQFIPLVHSLLAFDARHLLKDIKCPVKVIGSAIDEVLTGDCSIALAKSLGCDLYMYSDYGHAAYDEAPDYQDHLHSFFDAAAE